jgi:hypothetical protein
VKLHLHKELTICILTGLLPQIEITLANYTPKIKPDIEKGFHGLFKFTREQNYSCPKHNGADIITYYS